MHNMENDRKVTSWNMIENLQMYTQENVRKITPWKKVEKSLLENALPGNSTAWKMPEWKMHTMENERKSTYWKIT